jgi:hypothetical protein
MMTKFRVTVHGHNYRIGIAEGRLFWKTYTSKMMGFYTTRFVEAETANKAIAIVFELVRHELETDGRVTAGSRLELEEIQVDENGFEHDAPGSGYTFYEAEAGEPSAVEV